MKEIKAIPAFSGYKAGEPSSKLFIKNLNYKSIRDADLMRIYSRYSKDPSRYVTRLEQKTGLRGDASTAHVSDTGCTED